VVGINFNVLVLDTLFFEGNPGPLDERAEPARIKFEMVVRGVGL
jgi:hypothetical protein